MGIEFQSHTAEHRSHVEDLLARIHANPETLAEALVEPEGLDWKNVAANAADVDHDQPGEDTLLRLLRQASTMPRPQFLEALERQKVISESENSASTFITQRNEPRISVSREVEIRIDDSPALEEMHTTAMIDLSHHGARIERPGFRLIPGDPVHLVSGDNEARFRVIWVGEPGSPQEGQIGLQKIEE
jgi:PilZ domain